MTTNHPNVTYRMLEEGEIIQEGDEVEASAGWNSKEAKWVPAGITVGKPAPNPNYPAHRIYRRRVGQAEET